MKNQILITWLCLLASASVYADTQNPVEAVAESQSQKSNTATSDAADKTLHIGSYDLLQMLIKAGVLTQEKADELLAEKAAQQLDKTHPVKEQGTDIGIKPKEVRVPYVPKFIKNEIRDQVRVKLREEVVNAVIAQAEQERWGIPEALPEWVNRIKFKGDFRLRYQGDFFSSMNDEDPDQLTPGNQFQNLLLDVGRVNARGSLDANDLELLHNITDDRNRYRARMRLGITAKATEGVKVGMRLATGSFTDPVSTNQTMGNSFQPYRVIMDRAFIRMDAQYKEWTFWGGRIPNPWVSTDLVWDSDLNFDGLAYTYRPLQSDDMDNDERIYDTSITVGAFPLSEVEYSSKDKWLLGFQWAMSWNYLSQNKLAVALAYYDYQNIEGEKNSLDSHLLDYTAVGFSQKGNTMFNIANPSDPSSNATLFGLAADYNLVDLVVSYKYALFAPINVKLTADFVSNVGYDKQKVLARSGGELLSSYGNDDGSAQVNGYMIRFDIGWPNIKLRGNWDMSLAYKYLERDAVLDGFTDSDFHLGGSDAKGWALQGRYCIQDNTWLSARLISTDEISSQVFGVDTLQLDLAASF